MQQNLSRSRTDYLLAGVAGGIAEYLRVDPTLFRLLLVFAGLPWIIGLIVYMVIWLVIPAGPGSSSVWFEWLEKIRGRILDLVARRVAISQTYNAKLVLSRLEPQVSVDVFATTHRRRLGDSSAAVREKRNGVLLILFGIFLFLRNYVPWYRVEYSWPSIVMSAGLVLLMEGLHERKGS